MAAKILLASSNAGKLREFRELAKGSSLELELELFPRLDEIPEFEESAPTFAENSLGKALYYSRYTNEAVLADDSGLVVPSLGGRPGVHSARYAGAGATSEQRIEKLLGEINDVFPTRQIVLAREITKKFEEFLRGTAAELLGATKTRRLRGEIVVLIAGKD